MSIVVVVVILTLVFKHFELRGQLFVRRRHRLSPSEDLLFNFLIGY
jgi:hypothetical protein